MRVIAALLCLVPALARADAIEPFDGACPPGSGRAIRHHEEVCVPAACAGDRDCGEGAACVAVFECWADRPEEDDRLARPAPRIVPTVVGVCDADRHCVEGECRERRQCEPTAETPAWDRAEHRWTGRSYEAGGCSVARGGTGLPWALAALLLALGRRAWR